jgi:hypothetical protein
MTVDWSTKGAALSKAMTAHVAIQACHKPQSLLLVVCQTHMHPAPTACHNTVAQAEPASIARPIVTVSTLDLVHAKEINYENNK